MAGGAVAGIIGTLAWLSGGWARAANAVTDEVGTLGRAGDCIWVLLPELALWQLLLLGLLPPRSRNRTLTVSPDDKPYLTTGSPVRRECLRWESQKSGLGTPSASTASKSGSVRPSRRSEIVRPCPLESISTTCSREASRPGAAGTVESETRVGLLLPSGGQGASSTCIGAGACSTCSPAGPAGRSALLRVAWANAVGLSVAGNLMNGVGVPVARQLANRPPGRSSCM